MAGVEDGLRRAGVGGSTFYGSKADLRERTASYTPSPEPASKGATEHQLVEPHG